MRVVDICTFVEKARNRHGGVYDYSRVNYVNKMTKVEIICLKHGSFWQTPEAHASRGCPRCSRDRQRLGAMRSLSSFVSGAKKVHGGRYDYGKVVYSGKRNKICIVCPRHGGFWQYPSNHLNGSGCPHCAGVGKYTLDDFVRRAVAVYGDRFEYSRVQIDGCLNRVVVGCPKHGDFKVRPHLFLKGKTRCVECEMEGRGAEFVARARKLHGDRYDYQFVRYGGFKKKVCIVCEKHGVFYQAPQVHVVGGAGCPLCWRDRRMKDAEGFIRDALEVHGPRYDYSGVVYGGSNRKVSIVCERHGVFTQLANNHLQGQGCPRCRQSKGEEMVAGVLDQLGEPYERQKVFASCRDRRCLPFDFYLRRRGVLLEVDGVQHFYPSSFTRDKSRRFRESCFASIKKHDVLRNEFAKREGLELVRIPYWIVRDREKVFSWLLRRLGPKDMIKLL